MATPTEVCNMALGHLGHSTMVEDWETEDSAEAETFRLYYDTDRKLVLRDFPWPFAIQRVALALIDTNPVDEWGYGYAYPAGALSVLLVPSGIRPETRASKIPFEVRGDGVETLIYTDLVNGYIEYVADVDDLERWPPDAARALSYLIASDMAPRLAAGDRLALGDKAVQKYEYYIAKAQVNAQAEMGQTEQPATSEFERSRT